MRDNPTPHAIALTLNGERLHFSMDEFNDFRRLVAEAVHNLPRKTVRWADLKIEIQPHAASFNNGLSSFSLN